MEAIRARELRERAQALLHAGSYEEALEAIEQAVTAEPDNATGWALQGIVLSRLGRPEASVAAFERAVELAPGEPEHHFNLASQLAAMGEHVAALRRAEHAASLAPDTPGLDALLNSLRSKVADMGLASEGEPEREEGVRERVVKPEGLEGTATEPASIETAEEPSSGVVEPSESVAESALQASVPGKPHLPPAAKPSEGAMEVPWVETLPAGVSGWNWGAFWIGGLWAMFHGFLFLGAFVLAVHVAAFAVFGAIAIKTLPETVQYYAEHEKPLPPEEVRRISEPYQAWSVAGNILTLVGIGLAIWLGVAGNRMAWKTGRFASLEQFLEVQRKWAIWGWIAVGATLFVSCAGMCIFMAALLNAAGQPV